MVCFSGEGFLASFVYLVVYLTASVVFLGVLSRVRFGKDAERGVMRLEDLRRLFARDHNFRRRTDAFVLAYTI